MKKLFYQIKAPFLLASLFLHGLVVFLFVQFWHQPIEVVESKLNPAPIEIVQLSIPEIKPILPPAEISDSTPKSKPKPKDSIPKEKQKSKDSSTKDTLLLAFDTTGKCKDCLMQPSFPDPEFYKSIGVDSSWADILVKLDSTGQVVEVYEDSYVEDGIVSDSHSKRGMTKLYDENIQRGSDFWASTYDVALKWNFYKAAKVNEPKLSTKDLWLRYPPGKWILQRVKFKNPL